MNLGYYINNKDEKIRNIFISLIDSFGLKILFLSSFGTNNNSNSFTKLNIKLISSLMNLYNNETDEKIKKSILKAIAKTHSFGLERLIEKTEYIYDYKDFKKLFYEVRDIL